MSTQRHTTIITAAFAAVLMLPLSISAQHGAGPSMDEVAIENSMNMEMSELSDVVLVKKEIIPSTSVELPVRVNGNLERTVELLPNGMYSATLRTMTGEPVMIGTYKDEDLTQPHGTHAYFHWTGQLESKGDYRDGSKYGVWKRYDLAGEALAEKVYEYGGVEEMLIRNDQASFAGPFAEVIAKNKEIAQF